MSRRTLINLVFFCGVFLLMMFWAMNNIITVDRVERPYEITGDFAQAAGVQPNAEVTYLGVHYGRVADVDRTPSGVSVTMKIDRDRHFPAGAIARVFRKSAIGEPYIDFVPPESFQDGDDARIEAGENIPVERTTVPLEFSELLRSASALVSSIEPEAAGGLVHELSLALQGRGESLRSLTTSIDDLTATFVERTDQLDRLAENSTRVTGVLADHRLSIGQSLTNLRAVAETLRNADGDTRVLLEQGPAFLGTTADLVADQKQNLDCLLTDLDPVLRTMAAPEQLANLSDLLRLGPLAFSYAASTVDQEADGPWVRINLTVPVGGADPNVYVPPRTLPVVPSIPACDSTMAAVSAHRYDAGSVAGATPSRPAATGTTPAPAAAPAASRAADVADLLHGSLADTGGQPMAVLALVLAAGAIATWCARRGRERAAGGDRP
jgi:phospholipid/cholesterol/gamma-HCH transport system substrate-binding protein